MNYKLIDLSSLKNSMPLTITEFKDTILDQIHVRHEHLRNKWLEDCVEILRENQDSIEELISSDDKVNKLEHFKTLFPFSLKLKKFLLGNTSQFIRFIFPNCFFALVFINAKCD